MKKTKSKIFVTLSILFVTFFMAMGLIFFTPKKETDYSLAATNYAGVNFSIEKVNRFAGLSLYGTDPNSADYFSTTLSGNGSANTREETVFPITNEDTAIMLNNAEIESNIIEAVKISLLPGENYINWLVPTIKLNGVSIDCSGDRGKNTGTIAYVDQSTTDTCYKFIFYIDLTNVRMQPENDNSVGELIQDTNGYYEISILYHYRNNSNQTESSQNVINFGIYILDEVDYINSNSKARTSADTNPRDNVDSSNASLTDTSQMNLDKKFAFQSFYNNNKTYDKDGIEYARTHVEPRLYNTERIDRYLVSISDEVGNKNYYVNYKPGKTMLNNEDAELNFFNFNNDLTLDYDGNFTGSHDELLFPVYTYDASKYNLSWTFKYKSSVSYTVTSSFSINQTAEGYVGTVNFKRNGTNLFSLSAKENNGMYIVDLPLSEIGEYIFNVRYTVREYIATNTTTTSTLTNNYIIINSLSDKVRGVNSTGGIIYINQQKEYLVGDVQLSIFGYELYYTNEDNTTYDETDKSTTYTLSPFKKITKDYQYISDYTFLNKERLDQDKAGVVSVKSAEISNITDVYGKVYSLAKREDDYISKAEITQINLGTYTDICSTNQAPVEFKYLGTYACEDKKTFYSFSYYIHYPYGKGSTNGVTISQVTNSTRFTANGTYDVVVLYNYSKYMYYNHTINDDGTIEYSYVIQDASKYVHGQIFTFEIANIPPTLTIVDENNTTLNENDYTNKSVTITIEKSSSPFNVEPVLYCDFTNYTTKKTSQIKLSEIADGVYQAVDTGFYKITVRYGQGRISVKSTGFNIDKTPIANPTLINNKKVAMTGNSTNKNFSLDFLDKASGAPISVTYLYMPIDKINNLQVEDIFAIEGDESVIKNGYQIYQIFEESSTYKKNTIINVPGFYLFTLKDKAGNIGYKYCLYDTTSPLILQKEKLENSADSPYTDWYLATYMNNIVTSDSVIHWGSTKAIMLTPDVQRRLGLIKTALENYGRILQTYANTLSNSTEKAKYTNNSDLNSLYSSFCANREIIKNFLQVPISHIKVVFSGTTTVVLELTTQNAIQEQQEATFYTIRRDKNIDSKFIAAESSTSVRLYQVTSEDSLGNYRNALLEVNLDNSLVLIYSHSATQVKYEENNNIISVNYLRLYNQENDPLNYGTNREGLYITFKNGIGKYAIKTLSYSFYNLDFNKINSPTFPYSNISSITDYEFDLSSAVEHSGTGGLSNKNNYIIGPLNASSNNITTAGIYVVKRVYDGEEADYIDTGDTKEKTYTFLVDRNGIITVIDGLTIGEKITIGLGATNKQNVFADNVTRVSGLEFLVSLGSGNTLFTTNIVPIFYSVPENKYYFSNTLYSTLKPLTLNTKVYYDPISYRFDNSTLQDNSFVIWQEGNYKIVITDTTGYNTATADNLQANSFEFIFSIEYKKPEGNYTKVIQAQDGSELTTEISNEVTSVNTNHLSFYWTDPLTKFDAEIDPDKVVVYSYPTNGGGETRIYTAATKKDSKITLSTEQIRVNGNLINKYILNMDAYARTEAKYVVHLEYKGTSSSYIAGNPMFYNNIEIYVDLTAPNANANALISQDKFMTPQEKSNMLQSIIHTYREENNTSSASYYLNFENYVFVVDENFKLYSLYNFPDGSTSGFWLPQHDTYSVYIRKYSRELRDNATSDGSTLQSLIPSDQHYNEANYSTQYKFSPLLKIQGYNVYTEIKYDRDIDLFEEYGSGYYEIIEVDEAGNTSIYTIYMQGKDTEIYDMFYQSEDGRTYQVSTLDNYELNDKNIEMTFTQVTSKVDWFNLEMYDAFRNTSRTIKKTYNKTNLAENEYNTLDDILAEIKNFVVLNETMKVSGASFRLTFKHPTNTALNVNVVYNTPGELVDLMFEVVNSPKTIIVTVPKKTHTYIKTIAIYQGGTDANGNSLSSYYATFNPNYTQGELSYTIPASSGISYLFRCTDNFGRIYYKIKNVDIVDAGELIFGGATKTINARTYTAGTVSVRYQTKLYKISIEIDGVEIPSTEYGSMFTLTKEGDGIYNYQLVQTTPDLNLDTHYNIYLTPILQPDDSLEYEVQPLEFTLYTVLPELKLYSSAGKSLDYAINGSTAKDIYLSYTTTDMLFDVNVSAVCISEDNKIKNYTNLKSGNVLTDYGVYTIKVENTLGASYSFNITKKVNSDPYFTVYRYNHTSEEDKLIMANSKYSTMINSKAMYIDWYFSTFDRADESTMNVDIEKNEDLNIVVDPTTIDYHETIDGLDFTTKIYYIHTNTTDPNKLVYQKYIAVTFVDSSNNLLESFYAQDASNPDASPKTITSANSSINTSLSVTFIEKQVRVTWTPYFEYEKNLIYVTYYYNGEKAGIAYDGIQGITLIEAGVYQLEFSDFAGNKHLFGTNSATSSYSYQITMYNEILYTMNDESPVDYRIYNGPVTLNVLDAESLRNLMYTATLNGEPYVMSRTLKTFTFEEFGYYEIEMKANIEYAGKFVSLSSENETTLASISSKICFTILNADQARYAYSYSGNTIYGVYFNGKNVTTDVLNGLSQATNIVLTSDTIGYGGIFTVYAKEVFDGLRPDAYFEFNVWINNETPIIKSNIENGGSTTKDLFVYYNPYIIYNQVGICDIVITRANQEKRVYSIDPANQGVDGEIQIVNEQFSIELTTTGTYVVQIQSNGNTLTSFVVTKAEKLNTVAIIVIVLVVVTLVFGGIIFIKLRTRMKVK